MKLITVAGPPSTGKTSVLIKLIEVLNQKKIKTGVLKFDCLTTDDDKLYQKKGILVKKALSGLLCPDHFFVSNIEEAFSWALKNKLDIFITESAGLCNRCSPYIENILSVCIIDNLMGINTAKKIGPMLKFADIVLITKGDIVSQAEREVFFFKLRKENPKAKILNVNGINGQGIYELASLLLEELRETESLEKYKLRFSMPAALCSYCLGERNIGKDYQIGNVKKMDF